MGPIFGRDFTNHRFDLNLSTIYETPPPQSGKVKPPFQNWSRDPPPLGKVVWGFQRVSETLPPPLEMKINKRKGNSTSYLQFPRTRGEDAYLHVPRTWGAACVHAARSLQILTQHRVGSQRNWVCIVALRQPTGTQKSSRECCQHHGQICQQIVKQRNRVC